MPLKKHHKWMIGGASGFLIVTIIVNSLFIYILYGQLQFSYNNLETEIKELKTDTQTKFNELTNTILKTNQEINSLGTQIGDIDEEFNTLKASVGEDFSGIIEDSIKGVVTIRTNIGQGTGFIISDQGYLVTNAHVLSGARKISAITYEQKVFEATFIGYNSILDVALLKINGNFDYLKLDNSDNIQIGEKVIAIGNPLGLQFSVSEGIVSGTHRIGPSNLEAYIQTDAPLNPGNSGGPLINKKGKVIGINNFKIGSGESLGFALESNYIKESINNIFLKAKNETLI